MCTSDRTMPDELTRQGKVRMKLQDVQEST
jgi:hypothetical protein